MTRFALKSTAITYRASFVQSIELEAYRNYDHLRLNVGEKSVVLVGANGAGKTNLLEAISFLSPGRGLRRAQLTDIGKTNVQRPWSVHAHLALGEDLIRLGTGQDPHQTKPSRLIKLDGEVVRSQQKLVNYLSVIWITPQMDPLFIEGPSERRRFFDRLIYGFQPSYLVELHAYEKALRERSRLLKYGPKDPYWLSALEHEMAAHAISIAAARRSFVQKMNLACQHIIAEFPKFKLSLVGCVEEWLDQMPAVQAEEKFQHLLKESRVKDAESGGASLGPHRTDFQVLHQQKQCFAHLCSTGEQKSLLIALILSSARLQTLEYDRSPVLLLDEVAAHLDEQRRAALFDEINAMNLQAWFTGTDENIFSPLKSHAKFYRVANAEIKESI